MLHLLRFRDVADEVNGIELTYNSFGGGGDQAIPLISGLGRQMIR